MKRNELNFLESPPVLQHPEPSRKSLFLGDTNLMHVSPSDLGKDISIRTIQGANVNLLKNWIREKLNWTPARCFLYCGFQDIIEGESPSGILDNLGALITELKRINDGMGISVCQLVPALKTDEYDVKINNYNTQLEKWATTNGVSLLETNLSFRLGTGDIDEMCYNIRGENPGLFLNRYGVIRLLSNINKQSPYFTLSENWDM